MYLLILALDISSKSECTKSSTCFALDVEGGKGRRLDFPFSQLLHTFDDICNFWSGPPIVSVGRARITS